LSGSVFPFVNKRTIDNNKYIKIIKGIAANFKRIIRNTERMIKIYRVWFSAQLTEVNFSANIGSGTTINSEATTAITARK
jgi:hypothetical protein